MMGGAGRIIARGRRLFHAGEYLLAMEIANMLVLAEPENAEARDLLADVFGQLGYTPRTAGTATLISRRPTSRARASCRARW
jgi:alkyl sulfatase BDS1-like metallo-beta-lactamase superfamily hydrolase